MGACRSRLEEYVRPTEMKGNTSAARYRDSRPIAYTRLTQPNPYSFLHVCMWYARCILRKREGRKGGIPVTGPLHNIFKPV